MTKVSTRWVEVIVFAAICATGGSSVLIAQDHRAPEHSWTYTGATGPEHWGELNPEFAPCATGKQQSPIDITSDKAP